MNYKSGDKLIAKRQFYRDVSRQYAIPGEQYEVKYVSPAACLLTDPAGYDFVLSHQLMDVIFGTTTIDRFDHAMGIV